MRHADLMQLLNSSLVISSRMCLEKPVVVSDCAKIFWRTDEGAGSWKAMFVADTAKALANAMAPGPGPVQ